MRTDHRDIFELALTWQGPRARPIWISGRARCDAAAIDSQPEEWELSDDDVETGVAEGNLFGRSPFRRFKDVLSEHAAAREQYFERLG